MKKRIYSLSNVVLVILFFSCSNTEIEEITTSKEIPENEPITKSIVSPFVNTESTSNPTLYSDWENVEVIYLNNEGEVAAPWIFESGNSMRIPNNIRKDIKKEDGWIMLGHTLQRLNLAEDNYLLFYNKKTGILKGFYFSVACDQNQYARWILETTQPTSLFPSNEKVYNLSNQGNKYATSSNITTPTVISAKAPLVPGWNCFTFELPYGTLNHRPIINIVLTSTINFGMEGMGNFSGQVVVPTMVNSNELDVWKDFFSKTSSLTGSVNTFAKLFEKEKKTNSFNTPFNELPNTSEKSTKSIIGTIGLINSAVSIASNLLGVASVFTSKKEVIIQRYDFSGDIKLTGNIMENFVGLAKSADNLDVSLLNNNEALGVWGLKELPTIQLNKYEMCDFFHIPSEDYKFRTVTRNIDLRPKVTKASVIINPDLLPLIKDYKVTIGNVISTKSKNEQIRGLAYQEIEEDWHSAYMEDGILKLKTRVLPSSYSIPGIDRVDYYIGFLDRLPEIYVNVLVEIEYKDGSFLSSSRVFKAEANIYNNKEEILRTTPSYTFADFQDYKSIE